MQYNLSWAVARGCQGEPQRAVAPLWSAHARSSSIVPVAKQMQLLGRAIIGGLLASNYVALVQRCRTGVLSIYRHDASVLLGSIVSLSLSLFQITNLGSGSLALRGCGQKLCNHRRDGRPGLGG
jgi:hypothetical protein